MPPENPHIKPQILRDRHPLGSAMRRRTVITGAAGVGVGAVAGAHALLSPPRFDMSVPGRKPADIAPH